MSSKVEVRHILGLATNICTESLNDFHPLYVRLSSCHAPPCFQRAQVSGDDLKTAPAAIHMHCNTHEIPYFVGT